ncbi:MAG TPA: head GIN domain-containing protein [Pedobacter sp.]|uniref:head GIN domain-containing protein n=1 Tax=Pedobacter sp. TaxID=1411316 RepID=UPI002B5C76CE|nr:head GIN domain-containing protein [Pedobacter sp.]HMI05214.1 head GIN domain-containing protein [Pedobacter sp.]
MKKLSIIACLLPFLFTGCNTDCIEDSGNHIEKNTVVKPFDKISVAGSIILILRQDSSYAVRIATDSNLMKYVKVDVSGAQLNIKVKEEAYCGKDSIVVEAGIGALKELKGDGSLKVSGKERIYAGDLKLSMAGSSEVTLDLTAGNLSTNIDGTGTFKLTGQTGSHTLMVTGIADVDAFNFVSGVYKINVTGTAKANINVLNELSVNTEGSSEISYKGNPAKVNEKKSGAAVLKKVN